MYLLIDTATTNRVIVYLVKDRVKYFRLSVATAGRQTEKILPTIEKSLKRQGLNFLVLRGIGVVTGPGSFTSLRVGVVTANTLGYALKLPVVGMPIIEPEQQLIDKFYQQIRKGKKFKIVLPQYGREPNITQPRRGA